MARDPRRNDGGFVLWAIGQTIMDLFKAVFRGLAGIVAGGAALWVVATAGLAFGVGMPLGMAAGISAFALAAIFVLGFAMSSGW